MAYYRVSSRAQRPNLQNQRASLRQYAHVAGEVMRVIIAHQHRLARFGFALFKHLCETHETELRVMNSESLSPEQELVLDLITIINQIKNENVLQQVKEQLCTNI